MEHLWRGPYRVRAHNTGHDSENRIHDDATARRLGFAGGLVLGVDIYAYITHLPLARWGRDWLERGTCAVRFRAPVYDGNDVIVTAEPAGEGLALTLTSRGETCAQATAGLGDPPPAPISLAPVSPASVPPPPSPADRPPASEASLAPGQAFAIQPWHIEAPAAATYLRDIRETDPLYRTAALLHPGLLLRCCNNALKQNVLLGPWIHTASTIHHFAAAPVGAVLTVHALVIANQERKGHATVELDVTVLANGAPAAQVRHSAIWRPR